MHIFVTSGAYSGNLIYSAAQPPISVTATDGIVAGDAICAYEAGQLGLTGGYKALIAGTNRVPGGSDWVIQPSTSYTRTDNTLIGNSDVNGKLPSILTNAISNSSSNLIYTGFGYDMVDPWSFSANFACNDGAGGAPWQQSMGGEGIVGQSNVESITATADWSASQFNSGYLTGIWTNWGGCSSGTTCPHVISCANTEPLYCVQQPPQ
jgi:hypothetical protein